MTKAFATLSVLILMQVIGCTAEPADGDKPESVTPPTDRLVFLESAGVDDPAVTHVVREAMSAMISGDYDRFRSVWVATEEPIKRDQFERRWQPVREVTVRAIKPMRHAETGDLLYYVDAKLKFDPESRQRHREILFLLVRRNGAWRLSRAPESLAHKIREWRIKSSVSDATVSP